MATAKKTASRKTVAKRATAKKIAKKAAGAKSTSASHKETPAKAKGKKVSLVQQKRSTGDGPACWPGYERVLGKEAGTKGSCKPKPDQTSGERKEDARQAAGSKLRKAGGNKARANHTR